MSVDMEQQQQGSPTNTCGNSMMDPVSPIQVIVHQPSPPLSSELHMQLLAVPLAHYESGSSSNANDGLDPTGIISKPRRYSCNTPSRKGSASGANSPNVRRRSSLAAVKWSAIARRFSMGMSGEREPPEDPTKVKMTFSTFLLPLTCAHVHYIPSLTCPAKVKVIHQINLYITAVMLQQYELLSPYTLSDLYILKLRPKLIGYFVN